MIDVSVAVDHSAPSEVSSVEVALEAVARGIDLFARAVSPVVLVETYKS